MPATSSGGSRPPEVDRRTTPRPRRGRQSGTASGNYRRGRGAEGRRGRPTALAILLRYYSAPPLRPSPPQPLFEAPSLRLEQRPQRHGHRLPVTECDLARIPRDAVDPELIVEVRSTGQPARAHEPHHVALVHPRAGPHAARKTAPVPKTRGGA